MPKQILLSILGAAAVLVGVAGPVVAAEDNIKVGVVLPLTGAFTGTGNEILSAVQLFLQNDSDRVAGKKIELIVRDDAAVPDQTRRLTQELIINDKVSVVAGYGMTPGMFC